MSLFGIYLKHWRSEQGLTLKRIAEGLGVDPSYLSRLERGEVANPADEVLANLPALLGRPKDEVYLAAGRVTPDLMAVLEAGFPYTLQQTAVALRYTTDQMQGMFSQLAGQPLTDLVSPTDAETMATIQSAMTYIAEMVDAMDRGAITRQQFQHACETIRQLKLSVLAGGQRETP